MGAERDETRGFINRMTPAQAEEFDKAVKAWVNSKGWITKIKKTKHNPLPQVWRSADTIKADKEADKAMTIIEADYWFNDQVKLDRERYKHTGKTKWTINEQDKQQEE